MRLAFLGGHGHHYLRGALTAHPNWPIAISSDGLDPTAAQNLRLTMPGALWFDDPRTLLDQFQPDCVSIGAVYALNGDLAALALERDIKVVSDKPISVSWPQLERLRELAHGTPRVLLTEFPFRSQPEFRAARAAVRAGLIGEVVLATAQKSYRFGASRPAWYRNRALYGGTLLWVASHVIDAIRFCTDQPYKRVIGTGGNLSRPEYDSMEDHVAALFELENGGTALVHADFLRPHNAPTHGDDRLRIAGTTGLLEIRDARCLLIAGNTSDAEAKGTSQHDITASVTVRPVHEELLAALSGETTEFYSTPESLQIAAILLQTRDATDERTWRPFPR